MKFFHPLMHNNFSNSDMGAAIKLLKKKKKILTQSVNVKLFEKKWSNSDLKQQEFLQNAASSILLNFDFAAKNYIVLGNKV